MSPSEQSSWRSRKIAVTLTFHVENVNSELYLDTSGSIQQDVEPSFSKVQYSTVQYSTVPYSTVKYSTVQYSTVQYSTVNYSTLQYIKPQYNTFH